MKVKRLYQEALMQISESRNYILFILTLLFFSALFGIIFPNFFSDTIQDLLDKIMKDISKFGFLQLFFYILQNNLTTSFFALILGIIFGIFPVVVVIFNGYVLGVVMNKSMDVIGMEVFARLLPHGVFEIPAVAISLGLGLKLGIWVFTKKKRKFMREVKNSLFAFFLVVIPLLVVAALIESGLIFLFG